MTAKRGLQGYMSWGTGPTGSPKKCQRQTLKANLKADLLFRSKGHVSIANGEPDINPVKEVFWLVYRDRDRILPEQNLNQTLFEQNTVLLTRATSQNWRETRCRGPGGDASKCFQNIVFTHSSYVLRKCFFLDFFSGFFVCMYEVE